MTPAAAPPPPLSPAFYCRLCRSAVHGRVRRGDVFLCLACARAHFLLLYTLCEAGKPFIPVRDRPG